MAANKQRASLLCMLPGGVFMYTIRIGPLMVYTTCDEQEAADLLYEAWMNAQQHFPIYFGKPDSGTVW